MRRGIRDHEVKLPRVHRVRRGGRVYRYHRVTRALLPDLPETHPDFIAAWAAQEGATPAPGRAEPGTLAQAIADLQRGRRFAALSSGYRAMMRRELDPMAQLYGSVKPAGLRAKHIRADLDTLGAVRANKRLRAWRLVLGHCLERDMIDADPSAGIRKRAENTRNTEPWTPAEVALYRARWPIGTAARGCFELLWWCGCRDSDAVRLAWSQIGADGVLTFRQEKTKAPAHIPWTAPLPGWAAGWAEERAMAIEAVRRVAPGGFTMLEVQGGRVRSSKGLSNLISASARAAGIAGKTAHGLRVLRLTSIAEAGGSTQAIMSWGGHKTLKEAEHYTVGASRKRLVMGGEQEQNDVAANGKA